MANNRNNLGRNNNTGSRLFTTGSFTTAIVVLFFVFLGIFIYRSYRDFQKQKTDKLDARTTPPECPDYWEKVGPNKCKNTLRVNGNCNTSPENSTMDFDTEIFKHPKLSNKFKCRWARQCKVSWSGIDSLC